MGKRKRPFWCKIGIHYWNSPFWRNHELIKMGFRKRHCHAVQCKATKIEMHPIAYVDKLH